MRTVVILATAWGAKNGGIDAFSTSLAKSLGALSGGPYVICIVLEADTNEILAAHQVGVRLLPLGGDDLSRARRADVRDLVATVTELAVGDTWWVGHDLISGELAVEVAEAANARSVVINHMHYLSYYGFSRGSSEAAKQKEDAQKAIFRKATKSMAVGPMLRDRLADMLRRTSAEVDMLIPGLEPLPAVPPRNVFRAITFGRLDPLNDRIKQGRLAVAAFASACRRCHDDRHAPAVLRDSPQLMYVGLSAGSSDEDELQEFASRKAGRRLTFIALPFMPHAEALEELQGAGLAMMLSWHEGFGLTGWEAVAAGVPLVVSRNSGLYKLVDELLGAGGLACLHHVDVRGQTGGVRTDASDANSGKSVSAEKLKSQNVGPDENYHPDDEADAIDAILQIAGDPARARQSANWLRARLLESSCTWENTARRFLDALWPGDSPQAESMTPPPVPGVPGGTSGVATLRQGSKGRPFRVDEHLDFCLEVVDRIGIRALNEPWPNQLNDSQYKRLLVGVRDQQGPSTLEAFIKGLREALANPAPVLASHPDWEYCRESICWLAPGLPRAPEQLHHPLSLPYHDAAADAGLDAALADCEAMGASLSLRHRLSRVPTGWPRYARNVLLCAYATTSRLGSDGGLEAYRARIGHVVRGMGGDP